MVTAQLMINGERVNGRGGKFGEIVNPATEEVIGEHAVATPEDLSQAAEVAERAFHEWRKVSALQRSQIMRQAALLLRQRADGIAPAITSENGKTLAEATGEVNWAADYLEWFAEEGRRAYGRVIPPRMPGVHQFTNREPVGPVLALAPWNWPLVTAARKVSPALAAGCSIVLKPAEETPSAALALGQALADAGLPKGVLNIVFGVPAEISSHLIAARQIKKISFTGSVPVGRLLGELAGRNLKRITLELGGHAPVVIWKDADVEAAVRKLIPIKFRTSGQVCSCPSRFIVHKDVRDKFVDCMSAASAALKVGDGMEPGTDMGPLISQRRLEAMQRLVADAVERGGRVVTGGSRVGDRGYFFAPTVIDHVPASALGMHEEPFGPLVLVSEVTSYDEAVTLANATSLGLSAYVFTQSLEIANAMSEDIHSGMVGINTLAVSLAEAPFGGVGDSGYGQEGGAEGLDAYMVSKFVAQHFL